MIELKLFVEQFYFEFVDFTQYSFNRFNKKMCFQPLLWEGL